MDAKKIPTKKFNVIITLKEEDKNIIKEIALSENRSVKNWLESTIQKTIYKERKKRESAIKEEDIERQIEIAKTKWTK